MEIGDKLYIRNQKLYIDPNDCFQPIRRRFRNNTQNQTIKHLELLFEKYLVFLDNVKSYIYNAKLFTKAYQFAQKISIYNQTIFDGLYYLKKTHPDNPKIGAFLLHLWDYEDDIIYFNKKLRRSNSF